MTAADDFEGQEAAERERQRKEDEALAADVLARLRAGYHVEADVPDEALEGTFAYQMALLRRQFRRLVDVVVAEARRFARRM